jgi:hypothetical protein
MGTDHTVDILEFRGGLERDLREALDAMKALHGYDERLIEEQRLHDMFLEVLTWRGDDFRNKAELVLTVGGPTVRIEWDSRWSSEHSGATLTHSWGTQWGVERTSVEMSGDLVGEVLQALGVWV